MKKILTIIFCLSIGISAFSQIGGNYAFPIMSLPYNARSAGLGVNFITAIDQDVNLGIANPSLYNEKMNNQASFSHGIISGGINYGMAAYGRSFGKKFNAAANVRYMSYGVQQRTNEVGEIIGTFHPSDYVIGVGTSYAIDSNFRVGANFSLMLSQLDRYVALGASLDIAASYYIPKANLLLTLVGKNAGVELKDYTNNKRSPLPLDLQFGISHRLKHAPFRFSMVYHHIQKWNLSYFDPNTPPIYDPLTNDSIFAKPDEFGKKLAQHLTFQAEILLGRIFQIRAAFDLYRRSLLKVPNRGGIGGFSFGLGLYFKQFSIDYGINFYSVAGMQNMFTISTNFDKWKKRGS